MPVTRTRPSPSKYFFVVRDWVGAGRCGVGKSLIHAALDTKCVGLGDIPPNPPIQTNFRCTCRGTWVQGTFCGLCVPKQS